MRGFYVLLGSLSLPVILVCVFTGGGYRINLTASQPLGLWQVVPLARPVAVGDTVFLCPPSTKGMREARKRGYLRRGLCSGGFAPLIKTVVALCGSRVETRAVVVIDGAVLPFSRIFSRDAKGRTLQAFAGGRVRCNEVFVHASFEGSYDSRYFGPLPQTAVLGLAQEVVTYET